MVEFDDRVCRINEFKNENFEEIKQKLMSYRRLGMKALIAETEKAS